MIILFFIIRPSDINSNLIFVYLINDPRNWRDNSLCLFRKIQINPINNQFFNSKHLKNIKGKYRYLRKKLQAKGTHSTKRLLRKLSGKENRFQRDVNHCISKQIVVLPFDTFVLEDLEIKSNTGKGRAFNTLIANWSWYQLEQFLTYKALLKGKKVEYVDARYTSQKCSVCGYVYRGNRSQKIQSDFRCMRCGFRCHADLNASRNIKNNYIAMLGNTFHSRFVVITITK